MEILGYSLVNLVIMLIIAAVCGALVQAIVGFSTGGFLISLVLGFIGALLGLWLGEQFGLPQLWVVQLAGESYSLVWPIVGALLFAVVVGLVAQRLLVDA